jgi:hypothetical protein
MCYRFEIHDTYFNSIMGANALSSPPSSTQVVQQGKVLRHRDCIQFLVYALGHCNDGLKTPSERRPN